MAAIALSSAPNTYWQIQIPNPFHMVSLQLGNPRRDPPLKALPRAPEPSSSSSYASAQGMPETAPTTFKRFRSSLEQSLKTTTRSGAKDLSSADDFATASVKGKGMKELEDHVVVKGQNKDKIMSSMLRQLESRVGLRRTARVSASTPVPLDASHTNAIGATTGNNADVVTKSHQAGFTSFATPSLVQTSVSSSVLHLPSQNLPSGPSQPATMAPLTNTGTIIPARDRMRRASVQPIKFKEISSPQPLASRHDRSGAATPDRSGAASPRASKSRQSPVLSTPRGRLSINTPRRSHDSSSSPDTTPLSGSRGQLGDLSKTPAVASATHKPLRNSPPYSPIPNRAISPVRARTPLKEVVAPASYQAFTSASASDLPLNSSSPPTTSTPARIPSVDAPRRSSVDAPRRGSIDTPQRPFDTSRRPSAEVARKASGETSQRGSVDMHRRPTASPVPRACSPPSVVRPRATSPSQRTPAYAQNRFNISTASLISPSTPEQREVIRAATSLLCKELRKAPAHLARSDAQKEWAEVEVRLQPLIRLERVWGKSGGASASSTCSQVAVGGVSSIVLSSAGEERERKLFCEALRDGVVLCQLMNKHCSGTITRIDHREDGIKHTNNMTRFIAACSQRGVPSGDIFYRDDLVQATPETLCRVACTIISLIKLFEDPGVGRAKVITGQGRKGAIATSSNDPCSPVISRAASSAPNLLPQPVSPTFSSGPTCRMQDPHEQSLLPTRPDSPQSGTSASTAKRVPIIDRSTAPASNSDHEIDEVPPITGPSPTPRSHFRAQSRTGLPDDSNISPLSSLQPLDIPFPQVSTSQMSSPSTAGYDADYPPRQSRTSSNLTDNTAFSSIFDIRRACSSNQNKFGTIRTFTTEATSCSEAPSSTRTEASSVAASMAEEMSRRRGGESTSRLRERRPSEPGVLDLVSLAEEEENSACGSSSNNHQRESLQPREPSQEETEAQVRVRLGKGKWPDDFLDAFKAQAPGPSRAVLIATPSNRVDTPLNSSPPSVSPTRKLSIVSSSHHNDSTEPTVRRPSHRSTHSTDVLMPKNSVLRLDTSSENSPGSKVILRRQSTRNSARRNGVSYPRNNTDDPGTAKDDDPHIVPFPRVVSGEYAARATPSPDSTARGGVTNNQDAPRVRGRFQSDNEDHHRARRCSRPTSHDELGRPRRSRYESMVSLGVASANASATDLLSRDSSDGGAVRQTVIVKEEGKPAIHFQLGNCIGRGQFGTVYRALNLTTGQMVAIKRIRLEGLKEDEVAQLMREVDLMKRLSHPSIVKYEGMDRDEQYLNIVLEYAESGSLGQMLKAFGKLNEHLVASYVVKILEGLHYLHCCDVVHCDLKAANILTTKTGNIKLSDFGVSLNLKAIEREKEVAGTPNWMAPEVIELKGASTKADIWSLGCTVVELLTGRPPFWDITNTMTVMFRIVEDEMPIPEECSEPLKDFLQQCFQKEPLMRPNAELLCEHPWLKKNWNAFKDLRPQDSIPFLRRISTDFQKTEVTYLASMDINRVESPSSDSVASVQEEPSKSPRRRLSSELSSPISLPDDTPFTPRDHSFIKTTFGKPMVCRVCMGSVKRGAVICDKCNLITHLKCAPEAPLTCDLRSQLLQYAEQGSPAGISLDRSNGLHPPRPSTTVPSEVSFVTSSARPSLNITPSSQLPSSTPPKSVNHLKCSGSSLATENRPLPSASASQIPQPPSHDDVGAKRNLPKLPSNMIFKERPHSLSSNSTAPNASSIEAADSQSSPQELGRKSILSTVEPDTDTTPLLGPPVPEKKPFYTHPMAATADDHMDITSRHILGTMSNEPHRYRKRGAEKPSGCTIQ